MKALGKKNVKIKEDIHRASTGEGLENISYRSNT